MTTTEIDRSRCAGRRHGTKAAYIAYGCHCPDALEEALYVRVAATNAGIYESDERPDEAVVHRAARGALRFSYLNRADQLAAVEHLWKTGHGSAETARLLHTAEKTINRARVRLRDLGRCPVENGTDGTGDEL